MANLEIIRNSEKVFEKLLGKALILSGLSELGDSNIRRISKIRFNTNDDVNPIKFNRSIMSDGLHYTIANNPYDSYNILTDITLSHRSDVDISKANTRFGNNLDSIFVYINGKKVPDSLIWLVVIGSYTNVIIPKIFFIEGDNEIVFEKRRFVNYTYGGTHISDFDNDSISFSISSTRNLVITDSTVELYINGIYSNDLIDTITFINDNLTINLTGQYSGDVEVFIDSSIEYKSTKSHSGDNDTFIFDIDEDFYDSKHGSITKYNCQFFINGLRVDNGDIEQIGRVHFRYNSPVTISDASSTILFTDEDLIDNEKYNLYGDSYYLNNMIGVDKVTDGILNGLNGTIFDHRIDYDNTISIPDIASIIDEVNSKVSYEMKIYTLLEYIPELIKEFLEEFCTEPVKKIINYDGSEPTLSVGTNMMYPLGTRVLRIVIINGKIVISTMFTVTMNSEYYKFTVDGSELNIGSNDFEIIEVPNYDINHDSYREIHIDRTERYQDIFGNLRYRIETNVFGNIKTSSDIVLLSVTRKADDPDGIYLNDEEFGFKILDDSNVNVIVHDDKIYIDFGTEDPRISRLVISTRRHHDVYNFTINNNGIDSLFNEIVIGHIDYYYDNEYHRVGIPLIHEGTTYLIHEEFKERLFSGIDFLYRSPSTNSRLRTSGFLLTRKIVPGARINIALMPDYIENDKYRSYHIDDSGPNKYGLLYLSGLKFPFSHNYINVSVNNGLVFDEDIDILSDKLIRLYKAEVSLQNIYIELNFNISFDILDPFIELYQESQFEQTIENLFSIYSFDGLDSIQPTTTAEESDSYYESFIDLVDSNNKTPNPPRTDVYISDKYDLYLDAYMMWYKSDRSDHILDGLEIIPPEVLDEIELYYSGYRDTTIRDIVIHDEDEVLTETVVRGLDGYPGRFNGETIKFLVDIADEYGMSIQEAFDAYEDYRNSNIVYKRDLLPISAIETFDDDDILIGRGPTFKII